MVSRKMRSSCSKGAARPERHNSPANSPSLAANRTSVQSAQCRLDAASGPSISSAELCTTVSVWRATNSLRAVLSGRSSPCSSTGPSAASLSRFCNAATCQCPSCRTASKPAREPVSSAVRPTNRRANSGKCRVPSISRASSIKATARRRCCSERCRLLATSSTTAAWFDSARARRISSCEIPVPSTRSRTPNIPSTLPLEPSSGTARNWRILYFVTASRLIPGVRLASSVQKTSLARKARVATPSGITTSKRRGSPFSTA